jgi:fructose-bisphosphate aldolase class II
MLASLNDLLPAAAAGDFIVPAFNIFGMDEAWQVMKAAELERSPVVLMVNRDMTRLYPVELLGRMLGAVALESRCPVCVHLDHATDEAVILRAMEAGFTSVMFDGSQLSLEENIARSRTVANAARGKGVSLEGEVGSVPYPEDNPSIKDERTDPDDAARYAERSGVDALAVAVGNVHKLKRPVAKVDFALLSAIGAAVRVPLVLHGSSGIPAADMARLLPTRVAKCNIGTALRQAWGFALRGEFARDATGFDRLTLTRLALESVHETAREKIRELGAAGRA